MSETHMDDRAGQSLAFRGNDLAASSHPFDPLPILGGIFLAVFVIVGSTMVFMYEGMHRDATLSYMTGLEPGELVAILEAVGYVWNCLGS